MQALIEKVVTLLDEKKADSIQVENMKNTDYYVDTVIIATTISNKHGFALKDYVAELLRQNGEKNFYSEVSDNWTILDTGDMLIHLMSSEYRSMYNIEEFLDERKNAVNDQQ